jgi:hypothetical protein
MFCKTMVHRRLGLKLEEQLEALDAEAGMPPRIAARWAATEARRSALQWHPSRPGSSAAGGEVVAGDAQLAGARQPQGSLGWQLLPSFVLPALAPLNGAFSLAVRRCV